MQEISEAIFSTHSSSATTTSIMFCKCGAPYFPNKAKPLMITIFIFLIIPFLTNGLSFNFSSFPVAGQDIVFQGDAFPASGVIQLTGNLRSDNMNTRFGRAIYHKPLHLWDNTTKNLTDFTTHYSFVIDADGNDTYGDGLAFFLAPNGTSLPPASNRTLGRTLGLTWDNQELNTSTNHFVAVEFDIFGNVFDAQRGRHIGIDINSMQSVNSTRFVCNITGGEKCEAWISYDSRTHNLSAVFGSTNASNSVSISYIVNLMEYLPEWVTFGFTGSTGTYFATHRISSWEFNSTLEDNLTNTTDQVDIPPPTNTKKKTNSGLVVGVTVGVVLAVVVVVGIVWYVVMRRKNCEDEEDEHIFDAYMDEELERGTGPRRFSYRELAQATNNFRYEDKLGEGGFGTVHKGFIKQINADVAVKRVSKGSKQGIKEYAAEIRIITRLRHRNLVQLMGWCHERKELLLVYEFLPNGTLHSHLFKESSMLRWELRYKIAKDLGAGLLYLHEGWERCVLHRDIKASNIMLDSEFNAKLGDFGLAKLVDHVKGSETTIIAGTLGYMAPECATTGKASKEADVYSFGVVALEIACGRRATATEDDLYIVEWVWNIYESGKLFEAADPRLNGDFNEHEMERLVVVGLCCANPDSSFRPSIRQALHMLNFEAPLPKLPSKMPVPTFFTPPSMDMYSSSAFPSLAATSSVLSSTSAATSVTS